MTDRPFLIPCACGSKPFTRHDDDESDCVWSTRDPIPTCQVGCKKCRKTTKTKSGPSARALASADWNDRVAALLPTKIKKRKNRGRGSWKGVHADGQTGGSA